MATWLVLSLIALILWGVSAVTQKVACDVMTVEIAFVGLTAGFVPIIPLGAFTQVTNASLSMAVALGGIGLGVVNGLGVLTNLLALKQGGKASIVRQRK